MADQAVANLKLGAGVRREWFALFAALLALVVLLFGPSILASFSGPLAMSAIFVVLFATVLRSSLAVVRHAEHLAIELGDPFGTLILTLSITAIEVVSISAVILHGDSNPTLVRESLLSVVMIILNGMVGMSLLIGGWLHREQHYNLQGANMYIGVIIPLAVLSLVLPSFTRTTAGATLSPAQALFLILTSTGLYGAFLAMQTGRHRDSFADGRPDPREHRKGAATARSVRRSALLLVCYMIPIVILAEQFAYPIDYLIETLRAPVAFGGAALALLVALPEGIGAVRAAFRNQLQRAVNIFLGSVLATIGLTVPAMLTVGYLTDRPVTLGIAGTDRVMLLLTLAVSIVTFSSGRTNVLQGAVHLILFAAYLLLMVQG